MSRYAPGKIFALGFSGDASLPVGVDSIEWAEILPVYSSEGHTISEARTDLADLRLNERKLIFVNYTSNERERIIFGIKARLRDLMARVLLSPYLRAEVVFFGDWWECEWLPFYSNSTLDRDHPGISFTCRDEWKPYFSRLASYKWSATRIAIRTDDSVLRQVANLLGQHWDIGAQLAPLASNEQGQAIAFQLDFYLEEAGEPRGDAGSCIVLPNTELDEVSAVNVILSTRYGFEKETRLPVWLSGAPKLPTELAYESKLSNLEGELARATAKLEAERASFKAWSEIKKILYCNDKELERAVWETLRLLGAENLEEDPRGNKEDAVFSDSKGRLYVSEIKGFQNRRAKASELRQLETHKNERFTIAEDHEHRKPVLIVNHEFSKPPLERRPECIGSEDEAIRLGHCCVSTLQLYAALLAHENRALDHEAMWDSIHSTSGQWAVTPDIATWLTRLTST